MTASRHYAWPVLAVALLVTLWITASYTGYANPLAVPKPDAFCRALGAYLASRENYVHVAWTIARALTGLVLSIIVGVPLGIMAGRIDALYHALKVPVDFFRSIPSSALFFVFILTFGVGEVSKVMVVVYGCSLILFVNATYGSRPTPDREFRLGVMRVFGASKAQLFWRVTVPDALPVIAASIRTCISLAFVLVIVTEMFLGAQQGLGRQLYDAYLAFRVPEIWVSLMILGLIGYLANVVGVAIERRSTRWRSGRTSVAVGSQG